MGFESSYHMDALTAKSKAQELAFGPFAFQTALVMRETGLIHTLQESGSDGFSKKTLSDQTGLSEYGVSVLVDFGVDLNIVEKNGDSYSLGPVGFFIKNDEMTRVNFNFTRDVCYEALQYLEESIREEKPAGLQVLGDWATLYEGLNEISDDVKESWDNFDHFYSDRAFESLLPVVFDGSVDRLLDVGGNTGRWARRCLEYDDTVDITIMDLPKQLDEARRNLDQSGMASRVSYLERDLLDHDGPFPEGMDVIWMCQLLDCFSTDQIRRILDRLKSSMEPETRLYIVELFPDRQNFETAEYSLDAISLYFTCVANGNSRFYHCDTIMEIVRDVGLTVDREIDVPSSEHTALQCSI